MKKGLRMSAVIAAMLVFLAPVLCAAQSYRAGNYWHTNSQREMLESVPCPVLLTKKLMDGLYIGAGLGYDAYRLRQSLDIVASDGGIQANPIVSATGVNGSLFAGYGQYYDWFYIAGEIFINASNANLRDTMNFSGVNYNTKINVRGTYGMALLPGIKLSDTALFYLRLGAMRTFIQTQEYGYQVGVAGSYFSASNTTWADGVSIGLGIETAIYRSLSLRAEYNHSFYDSFTTPLSTDFSSSNDQVTLGLVYHIDLFC